jgi:serine/threonine-protein kinase
VVTLARPPLRLASGDRVAGRYAIIEHYGAGPLGHTYRAQLDDGARVALKVVAHELVPTAAERLSLVNEVQKLVGRDMSRVAVPLAAGVEGGFAFVVSPWVPGKSLRRVLGAYRDAGRTMPLDEVLGVLEGVVQALRQLHTWGAHGAVYPESVQISRDGRVVLTDAGIAGAVARGRVVDHFERFPDVMPYLSPEIHGGKASSAGSDLYALGALASELLTGDPGSAAVGIAGAMLHGLPPEVDGALRGLVELKSSKRAAALPVLLGALGRAIGQRTVPATAALPLQKARTDVWPAAKVEEMSRGPRRTKRG